MSNLHSVSLREFFPILQGVVTLPLVLMDLILAPLPGVAVPHNTALKPAFSSQHRRPST